MAFSSVPPGFVSHTSFKLKRVEKVEETNSSNAFVNAITNEEPNQMDATSVLTDMDKVKRSLKQRPWILFDQSDNNSEEFDSEQFDKDPPTKICLPKGVTHGCADCNDCLKVTGRWHPEDAKIDVLEEAPVFYPTEEAFKDTLKYVAKIYAKAEQYGICRIIPPSSWKPPCLIKESNIWKSSTFSTHVQRIDGQRTVDFFESTRKKRRILRVGLDCGSTSCPDETGHSYVKGCESEPGRVFTLENFKSYAADFKRQYFRKSEVTSDLGTWVPSLENIEAEYNRISENPSEEIEVLCGDNLETKALGSGFPTVSNDSNPLETPVYPEYLASGWNLNNLPRLPGSLLSFESCDTCHLLAPQAHVGMCFSSFQWKVEEHRLYSLSYLHLGDPKIWYGVPGKCNLKFEAATRRSFSDSSSEQPESHHRLVKQISPSTLKSQGIPVSRCIQFPGEFVLVFPGAYHSGFDSGFNFSEKACFAPLEWLPHGQHAVELYCEQGKRTSLSHDKLLLGAAREAVRTQWDSLFRKSTADKLLWENAYGKDGILTRVFSSRLKSEDTRRKYLCNSSQWRRMKSNFDSTTKKECSICLCDLHFSAAGCPCSADRYSCLLHAKQLCSCAWSDKFFLYRHEISHLNILVDALEGKFDAVYKWGKDDLGLIMQVHPTMNRQKSPEPSEPDLYKLKESISREAIKAEVKARLLKSLDAATAIGNGNRNGTSSVDSIMAMAKANVQQSTTWKKQKAKEIEMAGNYGEAAAGIGGISKTSSASLIPIEMDGASDVSSSSSSSSDSEDIVPDLDFLFRGKQEAASTPPKRKVPPRNGGHMAGNKASSGGHMAGIRISRQPSSRGQGVIVLSDDSDG